MNSYRSSLIAFLLALPIILITGAAVLDLMFVLDAIKAAFTNDAGQPSTFGFVFLICGLLSLPVALMIAVWPMAKRRKFLLANALVVAVILPFLWLTWGGLMKDFVNCDILQIPNCD